MTMPGPLHLGVDLGTSHTVALIRDGDTVTPLLFDGSPLLPSAVYVDPDGQLHTGRDAIHWARIEPARFEPNPKRRVDDQTLLLGETELQMPKVLGAVLERVRHECVRVTGVTPPTTLTHPATWGPTRRRTLENAATAAGFGSHRMLAEPVAAATSFIQHPGVEVPVGSAVVVFDFGGGTFDVSVLGRTADQFDVWSVDGAEDIGGLDIDYRLVSHLGGQLVDTPEWTRLMQPATPDDRRLHRMFVDDVRSAKEQLSRHARADLIVPLLNRQIHLTRHELDEVAGPLLARAMGMTTAVIRSCQLPRERVAGVFLVGGASRMPLVATLLHRQTGIAPTVLDHPELVVAHGATLAPPPMQTVSSVQAPPAVQAPAAKHGPPVVQAPQPPVVAPHRPYLPPADRPPSAIQAARVILVAQTLTLVGALIAAATAASHVVPWYSVMLVLAVVSATATIRARSQAAQWTATGSQYALITAAYLAARGGAPTDDPAFLLVPILLTAVCAVPLLHSGSGWFIRRRAPVTPRRTHLTRLTVHIQFAVIAFTVLMGVALLGFAINDNPGYAQWLLALHITAAIAAGGASWALTALPLKKRYWHIGLATQYGVAAIAVLALATGGGIDHSSGLALICLPAAATIPLTHAAKPSYTE